MTFNIIKVRYFSYFISICMLLLFIFGAIVKINERGSIFLYSIEFNGGYQVHCKIEYDGLNQEKILNDLKQNDGYDHLIVRQFGEKEFLMRIPLIKDDLDIAQLKEKVTSDLLSIYPKAEIEIIDSAFVGPGVGSQMKMKAMWSVLFSLIMMLLYIWIRFRSWAFSIANVFSLLHDVFVILLFLVWCNVEVSLDSLTAILFILGYSINDTIVIFSRIRSELQKKNSILDENLINHSVQQTFRRTLLTSFFTALVVIPLYLFGGKSLEGLATPILLGIIFGTYSSIGIACSALYDLTVKKK